MDEKNIYKDLRIYIPEESVIYRNKQEDLRIYIYIYKFKDQTLTLLTREKFSICTVHET